MHLLIPPFALKLVTKDLFCSGFCKFGEQRDDVVALNGKIFPPSKMASICTAGPVVESSSVSTSAASAEFEYSKTEIHTIHLEPSPSITCEGCTKGANYEETFQGPHKWRRILRHVPSTKRAKKLATTESSEQRNQNPQNFDSDQDMATEEEM